jgi:hypothetical protein
MRHGRGFGAVIIAGEAQHAAMLRRPGGIRMLQHIARAIDARSFRIPNAEDTILLGAGREVKLLRAPDRGRGELFVDGGPHDDAGRIEMRLGAVELEVVAAQRRAAIAGDEAARVKASAAVARDLNERQTHKRLDPAQKNFAR